MPDPVHADRRVAIAAAAAAGAALLTAHPAGAADRGAENIALARRHLVEVWQDGRFDAVDEIFHPGFVDHTAAPGQGPGVAGLVAFARLIKTALPDQRFEFVKIFSAGDLVVDYWTLRATHTGPLGNIPATGRKVEFHGSDIVRVQDGRIIEIWHVEDLLTMFAQMGLVHPPTITP